MRSPPLSRSFLCQVSVVLSFLSLLVAVSASQCNNATLSNMPYTSSDCAWGLFNFSALAAADLYGGDSSGAMSVFRLCGAVSDAKCSAASGGDGQMCRWGTNASSTPACTPVEVSLTTGAGYNFSYVNASQPYTGGVVLTIYPATPVWCNGLPAVTIVHLQCSPSSPAVPVNQLASLIQSSNTSSSGSYCPCTTSITIPTSLACATPPQSSSSSSSSSSTGGVSSSIASGSSSSSTGSNGGSFSSTSSPSSNTASSAPSTAFQCLSNPFGLNLSSLSGPLSWQPSDNSQQWFVNLCGQVTDSWCTFYAGNTSVCGYDTCNPYSSRFTMNYASPLTTATSYAWRVTDGVSAVNGIEYLQMNGQSTAGTNQQVVVRVVCSPNATTPYIAHVNVSANTATVVINTNLTCSLVVTDSAYLCPSGCCGMGYDFTALNYDLYGYDSGYGVWAIHMCGTMIDSYCLGASVCQNAACGGPAYNNPDGTTISTGWQPSQQSWSFINGKDYTGGVQMLTVNGAACPSTGTGSVAFTAQFLCDPTALHPNTYTVVQTAECAYTLTLHTAVVCSSPSFTSSAVVLSQPAPTVPQVFGCQFEGYDLSPLSAYDMMLPYQYYMFVTRVCGQVSDRAAQRYPYMHNSSLVQLVASQPNLGWCPGIYGAYLLSVWNPYLAVAETTSSGVQVAVVDGSNVGSCNGPRGVKWIFVCEPAARFAYIYSIVEEFGVHQCHYDLTIMTNIVCGAPSSSDNSTLLLGSSSCTGQSRLFNGTDNGAASGTGRGSLTLLAVVVACSLVLLSVFQS